MDREVKGRGSENMGERVALRIEIAGRTFGYIRRDLAVVPHGLDDILAPMARDMPPAGRDGWRLRSLPRDRLPALKAGLTDWLVVERQAYPRHYVPMAGLRFDDWWQGFSSRTRQTLSRKARRLGAHCGDGVTVRRYRTADEIDEFMRIAAILSAQTYQARLMQAGLPAGEADRARAVAAAAEDKVRAFLLFVGARAIAYLYLPVERDILIYAHLGYDPAFAALSPGTVLHVEAMRALFAEGRFRAFDFTEGDGAHKAQFARASVDCADILVLRPTLGNRAALGLMNGVDRLAGAGKSLLDRLGLRAKAKALIRR